MLVEFVHVKTKNSQAIPPVYLFSACFERGEEAHKLVGILVKIFTSKLYAFALKELQMQLLDELQMLDLRRKERSHVHLNLHGLLDDLKIDER